MHICVELIWTPRLPVCHILVISVGTTIIFDTFVYEREQTGTIQALVSCWSGAAMTAGSI